ncbi:agmatinase [Candidatus Micrarchaeota archaeon]|nr:agmatinase [Candidatus Micrarchaeota archaeon]
MDFGVKRTFLGFQSALKEANVVIVPVPYDATASYGVGTRFGPNAIIDASTQLELYDIELKKSICDEILIHTLDELAVNKDSPKKTIDNVEEAVRELVSMGKKPVIFGGEHSITGGALAAFDNISVLQIDAHADLRDSYEGTKYNHACVMRRVREKHDAVQVGIRSMSEEEADYIEKEKIQDSIFYGRNYDIEKIVSLLGDKIYVTVDIDGFDPSVVPGTGTPEPGGLLWEDVLGIMKAVSKKNVVGFDIVEVLPTPPLRTSEFIAAKLAYKMMGYFW